MRVEWFGQSAFQLSGAGKSVAIDPFGDMSPLSRDRGIQWDYPAIAGVEPDLLLVTHEHFDHNGVEAIDGEPHTLRSTAGTHDSPVGQVIGVASEHDEKAGSERGPNTIFCFELDGVRVCHMGDLGQSGLRPEQAEAIGAVDLLFVPVGGGPTLGAEQAALIVEACGHAGSCRCTTARRGSAFWRRPTPSWRGRRRCSSSISRRSRPIRCARSRVRSWSCPPRPSVRAGRCGYKQPV